MKFFLLGLIYVERFLVEMGENFTLLTDERRLDRLYTYQIKLTYT
jgi:hypothetical protein